MRHPGSLRVHILFTIHDFIQLPQCNNANQKSTTAIQVHGCIAVAAMQFLTYPDVVHETNVHMNLFSYFWNIYSCMYSLHIIPHTSGGDLLCHWLLRGVMLM